MNIKQMMLLAALATATAGIQAQQSEFRAPDQGFQPSMTRAEVRAAYRDARSEGATAQQRHDGQDMHYAMGDKSRRDVRAETIRSAQLHRPGDTRNIYFGQ